MFIIEKLKYLNLEIFTGKSINTKEIIKIRYRLNSTEEHSWHSSNGQLNLIVDLIQI
jgi:arginine decarboxylase-like protein